LNPTNAKFIKNAHLWNSPNNSRNKFKPFH
jgi:hypothetical protein